MPPLYTSIDQSARNTVSGRVRGVQFIPTGRYRPPIAGEFYLDRETVYYRGGDETSPALASYTILTPVYPANYLGEPE